MDMKAIFRFGLIALAALAMSSCAKETVVDQVNPDTPIEFGTYLGRAAQTKGSVATLDAATVGLQTTGFGVYAFYTEDKEYATFQTTPTAPNFMVNHGDGVVDRCRFKHPREQVIPEAFDLHVFPADQAEINQHIQADQHLYNSSCVFVFANKQEQSERDGKPDIAEVDEIEKIMFCQPQGGGNGFKQNQHKDRHPVFLHIITLLL